MLKLLSHRTRGHMTPYYSTQDAGLLLGIPVDGLQLWLQKGNPGTGSTWADASGNGNPGTLTNATWSSGAVAFDGSGDYVSGFPSLISPATGTRTIIVWAISTDSGYSRRGMVATRDLSLSSGFVFGYYSSNQIQYFETGGGTFRPTITMPGDGTRNMWAVTRDGTDCEIFLNNSSVASTNAFTDAEASPPSFNGVVGCEDSGLSSEFWQGSIEHVIIYDRVLSGTELTQIYDALL